MGTEGALDAADRNHALMGVGGEDEVVVSSDRPSRSHWHGWAEVLIFVAILAMAGWLRWTHVRAVSLHVDEYITELPLDVPQHVDTVETDGVLFRRTVLGWERRE